MITLTNPQLVKNVLGGATTVGYDKVILSNITYDPIQQSIHSVINLSVTSDTTQTPLTGSLSIVAQGSGYVDIQIPDITFHRRVALTGAQQTTVQSWITAAQNQVEQGLVSIGIIAGNQSTGL